MGLLYSDEVILNVDRLLALTVEKRISGDTTTEVLFDNGQKIDMREEIGRSLIDGLKQSSALRVSSED